jgi:hypothetical protein
MRGLGVGPAVKRALWITLLGAAAVVGFGGCKQVDERPAEWGYISPALFEPNCATPSCHSPAAAVSGLDFSTPENGYTSLTGVIIFVVQAPDGGPASSCKVMNVNGINGCYFTERPLVTPYDPAGSRVINTLRARDAPRMPPDRPLPEPDIELVERWILNGALEYPAGTSRTDGAPPPDAIHLDGAVKPDAKRTDGAAADRVATSDAARDRGTD